MSYYPNTQKRVITKNFIAFSVILIVIFLLIDRLLISTLKYLNYLDFLELGFELNKLANTLRLEGAILFIGIGPFVIIGSLILYFYVRKINKGELSLVGAFSLFINFFVVIVVLNIVGGIIYYICSVTPIVKAVNEFLSNLILIRVYINFPFIESFNYENSYLNFSIVSLIGLFLLKTGYFKNTMDELLHYFDSK